MGILAESGVSDAPQGVLFGFVLTGGLRFRPNPPWPAAPGGAQVSEGRHAAFFETA